MEILRPARDQFATTTCAKMNVIFVLSGLLALSGLTVAQVDYANLDLSEWVKYNTMLQWTNGYTQSEC